MFFLPLFHNLENAAVLVVGGGNTAARKLKWLVRTGANIKVVAPQVCDAVEEMFKQGQLVIERKHFSSADLTPNVRLVVAATNDAGLHKSVFAQAQQQHVLINCVDQPQLCTVIFPAIVDRYPILVAVSSMGAAPALSRIVRSWIETRLSTKLADLAELAQLLRTRVKEKFPDVDQRRNFWQTVFAGTVAEKVLAGDKQAGIDIAEQMLIAADTSPQGHVALVGAGPGDPELITVKAVRLLQAADVVLYDKLANPEILDFARRDAQLVYVGKQGPKPGVPPTRVDNRSNQQVNINTQLVEYAQQGKFVVRLKGGDPFIYGRGGEELESLLDANISVQVVPGITAAFGAAAIAGIPLTYRNLSQSVRFITGHRVENLVNEDWPELTKTDQTLVIYMGLVGLEKLMNLLLQHDCDPQLPVAVVENATYANQRTVVGCVADIFARTQAENINGPSVVIVGFVVKKAQLVD